MFKKVSGLILLLLTFNSLALTETRLLQISSSGQTVVFDAGMHERLKDGEFGIVLKQIKNIEEDALRVVPVAKVRSVKVGTDHSVWVIFDHYQENLLVKGDRFTLFTESNMIPGRRDYKTSQLKVISLRPDAKDAARGALRDDADLLARQKNYSKDYIAHGSSYKSDEDFELIELEKWAKHKGQRYRTGLYRSQNSEQFKKALRLEVFEGLVTQYLKRVNDPDFDYGTFYDEQMRMKDNSAFRKRSNFSTAWESHLAERKKGLETNTKLSRSILEKGERWSEDYSDEELGLVLENVSVAHEKERKARVISKPNRYHLAVDYGQIVSDNQTEEDTTYTKSARHNLSVDFEVTPLLKHDLWERFTLNAQISMSDDAIGVGSRNFDRQDQSFTMGVNWYPFFAPYTVSVLNLYLGTYFRAGQTKLRSELYEDKGNYTLSSIPGFRFGLRYTFKNGVALRFIGSVESTSLERTGSNKYFTELPGSIKKTDMNLALGLGYSF